MHGEPRYYTICAVLIRGHLRMILLYSVKMFLGASYEIFVGNIYRQLWKLCEQGHN